MSNSNTDAHNVACEHFALCSNAAEGVIVHPILGYVPSCKRCAAKTSTTLHDFPNDTETS